MSSKQKFIAVHQIQLIVDGEYTTIQPTYPLQLEDEKQINQLMTAGAIRKPEENEMRLFKEGTVTASTDQTKKPDGKAVTGKELGKMTKAELIALAASEQIAVDETATNPVLVKSIEDGRKAKADADTDPLV